MDTQYDDEHLFAEYLPVNLFADLLGPQPPAPAPAPEPEPQE